MDKKNTKQVAEQVTLNELAQQLRCPSGEFGQQLGSSMHQSNLTMTQSAIALLDISDGDSVLELGHGNAGHLKELLQQADNIRYRGLEISPLMYEQASLLNQPLTDDYDIEFGLYDGLTLPFADNEFDKIFSVNTLYFWQNPKQFMGELARCLKVSGVLVLAYGQKEFMQTLPFIDMGFTLYEDNEVSELTENTLLKISEFSHQQDKAISKTGDMVDRYFTVVKMVKSA
ncbi:class I SAM-dependent methyltransferase [Psychrobacter sp. I-STPA6b]|uniref:class I SAM-dependent methyltransferase n=1 Tax=Psychrobacter sp. I-STPA6b TaxID=2585718 RepID=UPI001D0C07B5|nr:class I SAM-dependent methyltransferase [Psychrobacter sp. I-STPA6b]